jgi:hypothetical protein
VAERAAGPAAGAGPTAAVVARAAGAHPTRGAAAREKTLWRGNGN